MAPEQQDGKSRLNERLRKPLGPMQVHEFQQDPEKTGSACRFCGLDEGNPTHKNGAGPL